MNLSGWRMELKKASDQVFKHIVDYFQFYLQENDQWDEIIEV